MQIFDEGPILVDNKKSWIHCLLTGCNCPTSFPAEIYHYHDYIEMLYILEDGTLFWNNGVCRSLKKGEVVIIPSNVPHSFSYERESHYICVKFLPHILFADDQAFFELKYILPFVDGNVPCTVIGPGEITEIDIDALFFEILNEWHAKTSGSDLIMRADVLKLFAFFFRYWHRSGILHTDQGLSQNMKKVLTYISENYASVTEKQAAEISSLSYHYFSAVFKKTMRVSFVEYVTMLKLRAAENLLITTDLSVTEIASQTGFSTTSHFIHTFKKHKNMTPKQFRAYVLSPRDQQM